jgi:hypothetical protein
MRKNVKRFATHPQAASAEAAVRVLIENANLKIRKCKFETPMSIVLKSRPLFSLQNLRTK